MPTHSQQTSALLTRNTQDTARDYPTITDVHTPYAGDFKFCMECPGNFTPHTMHDRVHEGTCSFNVLPD